ncbi:MAG: selenocysteine-specific translation elongation factor [Promethearchaeati archaeon SRVP18_Atabeyarchaeia-1]
MIPVHVGLFGHVDHGKTELARALSEKVSTAGLDGHPEAKRRQMTIDIGFTAFTLGDYLVTLVDVPGHADLVRTAVSGANIIDLAILVVSAKQGPQIQTGEHLVLLESLKIRKLLVALTYADLVEESKLSESKESVRKVISDSSYADAPVVAVSSITGLGLPELKKTLLSLLSPPERDVDGKFKMVIDHSFPIKGAGTVVTGTIMRGKVKVGDDVEISPIGAICRVKSIQTFSEPREKAEAGDRVGIALQGVDHRSIYRGCYASSPKSLRTTFHLLFGGCVSKFFKHEIAPGLSMHAAVGMSSIQSQVFPYLTNEQQEFVVASAPKERDFTSYIRLSKSVVVEKGDKMLLLLLSLPPTNLRIAAGGTVLETLTNPPPLKVLEKKSGAVTRITPRANVIVSGLAKSKIGAEKIIGKTISKENGDNGTVSSAFGGKGLVVAEFERLPQLGEKVFLRRYRDFNIP